MKRINISEIERNTYKAMVNMESYVRNSQIPQLLRELIKIRASQINGCAYFIDIHTEEALFLGETPRRIFAITAWRDSPLFTEEERAALQLTEEVTLISKEGVTDETYNRVIKFFGERGVAHIILQIVMINSWNRVAVSTQQVYEPTR
ncbi:MAG: carboxymuconolactone decarboxylase family protein [Ginsengibacter sp.]